MGATTASRQTSMGGLRAVVILTVLFSAPAETGAAISESISSVLSVPEALSATMCDKLAAQVVEAARGKSINGSASTTLQLEKEAVKELINLGIFDATAADVFAAEEEFGVWTVPATIQTRRTIKPHVDKPRDGIPFGATKLIYLTDANGALHFPATNDSVAIKRGSMVAFPAGTVHAVVNGGPRVYLGPFTQSHSPRSKRQVRSINFMKFVPCTGSGDWTYTYPAEWTTVNPGCGTGIARQRTAVAACGFDPEECCLNRRTTLPLQTEMQEPCTDVDTSGLSVGAAVGIAEAAAVALVAIGVGLNRSTKR